MSNFRWVKGGSSKGNSGYLLMFDYQGELIDKLKATIPNFYREWNPETKQWWVSEYCEKQINDCFPGFLEAVVAQKRLF